MPGRMNRETTMPMLSATSPHRPLRFRVLGVAAAVAALVTVGCVPAGGGGGGGVTPPAPHTFPASFVTAKECSARIGANGGTGFWDIGRSECWSCPSGSARTIFAVNGSDACQVGGVFGNMIAAEYLGTADCPTGTFQNGSGCFACPPGTVPAGVSGSQPVCQ